MTAAVKVAATTETFLGRYRSQRLLGEGGMGQVYLGLDLRSGDEIVIKVMHDHLASVPSIRKSFQSELQLMMQFRHPYSVRLIDGSADGPGRPCLIMEYIDGLSLEQYAETQHRFTPQHVGAWIKQLGQVLYAAHRSDILHRDLTLNNLMLLGAGTPNETIKVMDFGLARLSTAFFIPFEKLTGAGSSLGGGTPDYVAPEQARGEQIDHRADLYSVGVVLYRLLAGVLPFQEFTETEDILAAHRSKSPPTFAERGVTDVPHEVEMLVRQLLSKNPSERPADAKQLTQRYLRAIRMPELPAEAFDVEQIAEQRKVSYDEKDRIDRMEAWMPESIAIMKLRAFSESVGGELADSEPGRIRIRVADPRTPAAPPTKSGFFSVFRRAALPTAEYLNLDLYMVKKDSMVELSAVLERNPTDSRAQAEMRTGFGQRICRELRAYLMISR
jgi:eukaryotic-like serine/threonine-protein kinase